MEALEVAIRAMRESFAGPSEGNLRMFDRIVLRKLRNMGRAEIKECTDGSDVGFLHARGFMVAARI